MNSVLTCLNNDTSEVCVPRHISKYGVYSSHLFLINAIFNYLYNYKILTVLGLLLYTTSVLHWRKVKQYGLYKTLDVTTCVIVVNYISFNDSLYFHYNHRLLWLLAKFLCIVTYFINKYIEMYQMTDINKTNYFLVNERYRYFSLKYTIPGSRHRELAHYYLVFVHILFIHVPLVFTCINGVVNTPFHFFHF